MANSFPSSIVRHLGKSAVTIHVTFESLLPFFHSWFGARYQNEASNLSSTRAPTVGQQRRFSCHKGVKILFINGERRRTAELHKLEKFTPSVSEVNDGGDPRQESCRSTAAIRVLLLLLELSTWWIRVKPFMGRVIQCAAKHLFIVTLDAKQ
ncbi:MAG: hypothetical protein JOZ14_10145 [Acidobacteria bacterium]|nr:hypothetical protein [Acidobacteriota bacterium]